MTDRKHICSDTTRGSIIIPAAALIIVIAGLMLAKSLLVPLLLSAFIAITCSPALVWIEKKGVPRGIAFCIVLLTVIITLSGIIAVVGTSINDFSHSLPIYKEKFNDLIASGIKFAEDHHLKVSRTLILQHFNPGIVFTLAGRMIGGIGNIISQGMLIFITVAFILFETSSFPRKMAVIHPESSRDGNSPAVFTRQINKYLAIKALTSLATGILVTTALLIIGVDFPYLWGMFAFFLNFIPNIGSFLAAVPAVILALVQLGPGAAAVTALAYIVINFIIGNIVEPKFMGKELGLSSLVVFLSLIFWGWVFGPVGMFLSVPLTMTIKIFCDSRERTKWIGVLLGP